MAAKKTTTGTTKTKAAAPKATKSAAPATATKTAAAKAPAKKPVKLSDAQQKILLTIDAAGEKGYAPANKTELRSIEKLRELKLVKRGAKDKATGQYPYMTSATGKKHLAAQATA